MILSGHVKGVAGLGPGEEATLQRVGGFASREHALLGLGNSSIRVDTLGSSAEYRAEILLEFDRMEVGVEILARQITQVIGILWSVVATNSP
jgi:hypothetical protein